MTNTSGSHPFDGAQQYRFQVCHPALSEADPSFVEFAAESTYPRAIKACIALNEEFDLPWVQISHGGWSRTIYRDALWLTHSGILISKRHSIFREGRHESQLLIDEPLLKKTPFGWGFYGCDSAMDGMAFKYIGWHLNPMLYKYFEWRRSFEYHLFDRPPDIPDWLDAEYFESEQAIAVYGEKTRSNRTGVMQMKDDDTEQRGNVIPFPEPSPLVGEPGCTLPASTKDTEMVAVRTPLGRRYDLSDPEQFREYMAAEMHIALQIQAAFGKEEANEWVKFHRAQLQSEDSYKPEDE